MYEDGEASCQGASPLLNKELPVRIAALLVRHSNPRSSEYEIGFPATSLRNWVQFVKNSRLQVVLQLFDDGAAPNNL
jgi:hypothetical protein